MKDTVQASDKTPAGRREATRGDKISAPEAAIQHRMPTVNDGQSAVHPQESAVRREALAAAQPFFNTAIRATLSARREVKMLRTSRAWIGLCLTLGLVAGGMPAQASEVVKLARLVVSGKRSAAEAPRPAPSPARASTGNPQAHSSGGSNDAGTAPAPARGVS